MALIAAYDPDGPVAITTVAELDAVVDQVVGWGHRAVVELKIARPVEPRGRQLSLTVGIHGAAGLGTLIYSSPDGVWFGKATPGPEWAEVDERVLYFLMSADTEYPPESEIPLDVVRRAAQEYWHGGGSRPGGVGWCAPPPWYPTAFR
ncbi:hypothetical protein GCM10022243_50590 [Saccharothrix violaceirubra]|uniref:Uncharacterized protein n=1 Tax=Saccharothrix violaceirubra TaxID=413306 RepID=A0A7W7SZ78_9PSEU|nr:Imm1 family immunity protein [Saccharothrix violaceirubra]MBB4963599.1 hypothetical protein [Saccharothrix violaceirubra]